MRVLQMFKIFWGMPIFICFSLSAVIFHEIDTTVPLPCIFSLKHHNRIIVDKSRVNKIIYPEENISIRLEEHSGQAFIYAIGNNPKPLTLAIVTDNGLVQDIEIEFADRPAEVVILKEPEEPIAFKGNDNEYIPNDECMPTAQINAILSGQVPPGYVSYSLEKNKRHLKMGVQAEALIKLQGSEDSLYLYQITNLSNKKRKVLETDLECIGSQWIFLETQNLAPKEKIFGIVCVGHA